MSDLFLRCEARNAKHCEWILHGKSTNARLRKHGDWEVEVAKTSAVDATTHSCTLLHSEHDAAAHNINLPCGVNALLAQVHYADGMSLVNQHMLVRKRYQTTRTAETIDGELDLHLCHLLMLFAKQAAAKQSKAKQAKPAKQAEQAKQARKAKKSKPASNACRQQNRRIPS